MRVYFVDSIRGIWRHTTTPGHRDGCIYANSRKPAPKGDRQPSPYQAADRGIPYSGSQHR